MILNLILIVLFGSIIEQTVSIEHQVSELYLLYIYSLTGVSNYVSLCQWSRDECQHLKRTLTTEI